MEELIEFDKQLLLFFNGSDSLFFDGLMTTLTTATTWIPLYISLLYLVVKNNDNMQKVMLIVGCAAACVLLAGTLNDMLVKPEVARWRPTHDADIGILTDIVNGYRGGRYGFFSSHAANTFSIAIFFSLLVRSKTLTITLILWSLINCWTRMYLGVHFPGDILCGILWGAFVGTGIWFLHRRIISKTSNAENFISTQYTTSGYQKTDIDVVTSVMVFTVFYAILRACFMLYI